MDLKAKNIVKQLTLDEKLKLITGKDFWHLQDIPAYGLQSIMVTDGPHGLRKQDGESDHLGLMNSVPATCYPTAAGLASTWNVNLIREVGEKLGKECLSEKVSVLLGPGVNIKRNPLGGRNFEYFSEDPLLTGKLASNMVKGVQSQGVGTSIKHFAVNNQESFRMSTDALVDERTLREIYLKGFEIAVKEAQPWTVMCSYNKVNGKYASENQHLLKTILKEEWQHEGLVVTDWGANNDRIKGLIAGQDLEMPSSGSLHYKDIKKALKNGELDESTLDARVERIVELIIKGQNALKSNPVRYDEEEHHAFARKVASEAIVLLKNDDEILPLKCEHKVALIGEFAVKPRYQGSGSSLIKPTRLSNAYDAFKEVLGDNLIYAQGYDSKKDTLDQQLIDEAVQVAKAADYVVLMVGLTDVYESEGFDRDHLNIPRSHLALIEAIQSANSQLIVSLSNGSPVIMPWENRVKGIVEQYLGGQASGQALADVIFGFVNPSGKLAETFPKDLSDVPSSAHFPDYPRQVQYREGLYVGYRGYDTLNLEALFPFGYGLSYTMFEYANLKVKVNRGNKNIDLSFDLSNVGKFPGKEIAQVYVSKIDSKVYRPLQELKAFDKIELDINETKRVKMSIAFEDLAIYQDGYKVECGSYLFSVGASSKDIKLKNVIDIESEDVVIDDQQDAYRIIDHTFNPSKSDFEKLLGYSIPEIPAIKPYHLNSLLGEIKKHPIGKKLTGMIQKRMTSMIGEPDEAMKQMMEKTVDQMPLRALITFSGGKISKNRALGLLDLINNRFIRGLFKIIKG
ncbi:beta-glucosidase family protein [Peloplasma aerotolerans]|uniref:Glycoside hydrolase family 3 C-terminal domain-containing protein n=1 Tax=Peloplasma aerotolerans TaxID=3044389 RepID=A0AAW6U6T0_9MOLU|nr:glycoside hydrolase family 3 C-terminal domain-containing protein [Mariniplasma sp. M4Ah]MDI6453652.1 glycoside hydrolase family 3 C-terminal domain-containing protein [Mariniplasma sp. M4Ah]